MRKIRNTLIIVISLFLLASCSTTPKYKCSELHRQYGLKAIEIADNYLDFNITASEAYEKLNELCERENELPKTESNDETHFANTLIEVDVSNITGQMMHVKYEVNEDKLQKIIDTRNRLADDVGVEKRG